MNNSCFFCDNVGGKVLYHCDLYRIILATNETDYPGFIRVILNQHIKEISDLSDNEAIAIYTAVLRCEKIIRKVFSPDKVNVASLGNLTPHVHWHIIPRYLNDKHYPNPIWGAVTHEKYQPSQDLLNMNNELIDYFASHSF